MTLPRLKVITDVARYGRVFTLERVSFIVGSASPGTVVVELRDHTLSIRERLSIGAELCALTRGAEQRFIVNDRVDLVLELGADGVQLGERSVSPLDARRLLGPKAWVSASLHEPEAPLDPELDALTLSPIFIARKGRPALGAGALEQIAERARSHPRALAVLGLGGVTSENAKTCLAVGASGVAVIGAAFERHPSELTSSLAIERR